MKKEVLSLRPTQFAVGMREVSRKVAKMLRLKEKELADYLHERPIPVVLGQLKEFFIVDHHHLLRACWEVGVEEVPVEVKGDLNHLEATEFWAAMKTAKWTHLYDQFGKGPHSGHLLPEDVRGLADDPYRSLAWAVREAGGYDKSDQYFCEFRWGEYFRSQLIIDPGEEGYKKALKKALQLCHEKGASELPGFRPDSAPKAK